MLPQVRRRVTEFGKWLICTSRLYRNVPMGLRINAHMAFAKYLFCDLAKRFLFSPGHGPFHLYVDVSAISVCLMRWAPSIVEVKEPASRKTHIVHQEGLVDLLKILFSDAAVHLLVLLMDTTPMPANSRRRSSSALPDDVEIRSARSSDK